MSDRIVRFSSRDEWLAWRKEPGKFRIGASEVAIALELSKWGDPWELWAAHHRPDFSRASKNDGRKEQGLAWEPALIAMYNSTPEFCDRGPATAWPLQIIQHPEHPWLFATLDATIGDDGVLELKTDSTPGAKEAWGGTCEHRGYGEDLPCPPWYAIQCAIQMACADRSFNDLMVSIPAFGGMPELRRIRLLSDPNGESAIVDAVANWREQHLVRGVEPTPVSDEVRMASLAWRYPPAQNKRPATDAEAELLTALDEVMDAESALSKRKESMRVRLAESMASSGAQKVWSNVGSATLAGSRLTVTRK